MELFYLRGLQDIDLIVPDILVLVVDRLDRVQDLFLVRHIGLVIVILSYLLLYSRVNWVYWLCRVTRYSGCCLHW